MQVQKRVQQKRQLQVLPQLERQKRQLQVREQRGRVRRQVPVQQLELEFQQAYHKQPERRQRRQLPRREICSFLKARVS